MNFIDRGAEFSMDRSHRFTLWREWSTDLPTLMVIGLNPSTADEHEDDPTIRRCIGFANHWGFGRLEMTNLFAFRSTNPKALTFHREGPMQRRNLAIIGSLIPNILIGGGGILAAWGANGAGYEESILRMFRQAGVPVACLGTTKNGSPKHPLYIPYSQRPVAYMNGGGVLCGA